MSGGGLGKTQIYSWNGTAWVQRGSDLNNESGSDTPSWISLSDDGNTVAIGSWNNENQTGHTRIYAWNGSAWVQRGSDIDGETSHNRSGYSVSLSSDGNTVAIGAPHNDGGGNRSGHTRIYAWNGSSWFNAAATSMENRLETIVAIPSLSPAMAARLLSELFTTMTTAMTQVIPGSTNGTAVPGTN